MKKWIFGIIILLIVLIVSLGNSAKVVNASTTWNVGDVFAGISSGKYNVYDNSGVLKETITDAQGTGFTTGCAFNTALDKLYTTNFSFTKVNAFDDASPHAVVQANDPSTDSPGVASSESIVFAANGDYYVGHADGNADVVKYNSAGAFQAAFDVPDDFRGSDWIDLAADQSTLFYTSEGRAVQRYDLSGNAPLPNFAVLPGTGNAFALRILPPGDGSGGLIVADRGDIKRLDGAGAVSQTYDVAGEDNWFALNIDPNGTSFWAGDFGTNNFYRFHIASGAVEVGPIASGGSLFGLCVKGELTAALPEIKLDPPTATNGVGEDHMVTATVTQGGNPVVGALVNFSVALGPNIGQVSDPGECSVDPNCNTDAAGQTSWTYTGNGGVGVDVIVACFTDNNQQEHCTRVVKRWVDRTPPKAACTETVNPHGKNVPPAGKTTLPGPRGGDNEDGFYELLAKDDSGLPVEILVMNLTGTASFGPFVSGDKVKITEAPGAVPSSKPMGSSNGQAGAIAAHITLDSDAVIQATDAAGNVTKVSCLVPPPPK